MSPSLQGRFALITGAASGIGRATALLLAEKGVAGLALIDRDGEGLISVARDVERAGISCLKETVDVRDADAVKSAFDAAVDRFGALHYVHNNVGIMTGFPPFPDTPLNLIDRVIAVNLRSVVLGTQFGFQAISKSGGGSILNTSSGAGKVPLPSDPIYAATKAGINNLSRSCVEHFKKHGVRINVICPGIVDTAILEQNHHPDYAPLRTVDAARKMNLQVLTSEQIAEHAVELLTDESITGELRSIHNDKLAIT